MKKRMTTEEFVKKANKIHNCFYTYEKFIFINWRTKSTITCPIHGGFQQMPYNHLFGYKCKKCSIDNRTMSTKEFIKKANKIHNGYFCYSKTKYKNCRREIIITCPEHGDFEQMPCLHLIGCGCKQCYFDRRRMSKEEFIKKANEIHNNFYSYLKVDFRGTRPKVIITCPIHGDFKQRPDGHLEGKGCTDCGILEMSATHLLTLENFIERANKIHNFFYDYLKVEYINAKNDITITCPLHGDFPQKPGLHLAGKGCKKCCSSWGEKLIRKILQKYKIKFNEQEKLLQFKVDFYLLKTKTYLEFNGIQHYEITKFSPQMTDEEAIKKFENQQKRDNIIRQHCFNNNLNLIEIDGRQFYNKNNFNKIGINKFENELEEILIKKLNLVRK